jgi:hypothetical protein
MDALEAGSKTSTEPRKRKRSAKDGPELPPPPQQPIVVPTIKQEAPATPPVTLAGPVVTPREETSPIPMKPMFNVIIIF